MSFDHWALYMARHHNNKTTHWEQHIDIWNVQPESVSAHAVLRGLVTADPLPGCCHLPWLLPLCGHALPLDVRGKWAEIGT